MGVHSGFVDGPNAGGGFHEEDHPRDSGGRFAPGAHSDAGEGSGSSGGSGSGSTGGTGGGGKATAGVDATPATRTVAKEFFGREMSDRDFQELTGAPDGAHVMVDALSGGNLSFHVQHPLYQQMHLSYAAKLPNGKKFMQLELHHLKDTAPPGMGTKQFGQMIDKGRDLGLSAIHIPTAARTSQMVGYYVWPRLGADGKIPEELKPGLPAGLKDAQKLSDLMRSGKGKQWWKANGKTVTCTFDLDPNSVSGKVWDAYQREKRGN